MKDGFGEEEYYDGSRYIGQFKENKKNGEGNLILVGGDGESLRGLSSMPLRKCSLSMASRLSSRLVQ